MNIKFMSGFKFLKVFSKVSTHSEFHTCSYLIQRSNWSKIVCEPDADVFGTLSAKKSKAPEVSFERNKREEWEEKEEDEERRIMAMDKIPENLAMKLIIKCTSSYDYDGAMKHYNDFVAHQKANQFMYRLILKCGANLGKAQENFSLLQDLKKRDVPVHPSMYTSLLRACANCKDSELALRIGKKVQMYIVQEEEGLSDIHVHALLMVFAKHGDIKSAFNFVDYLHSIKFKITVTIFNHLIENCYSCKEFGLRIAVLLYHKMLFYKILPNQYTFSILIRCIENCSFGNSLCTQSFLKLLFERNNSKTMNMNKSSNVNEKLQFGNNFQAERFGENDSSLDRFDGNEKVKKLGRGTITGASVEEEETSTSIESYGKCRRYGIALDSINVLKPKPLDVTLINCEELDTPGKRFMIFGGLQGFLEVMSDFNVEPDLKILTQLLKILPYTDEAEQELVRHVKKLNLEPCPIFYNILLNRMVKRNKFEKLEEYFEFLKAALVPVDVYTIGTLAQLCDTKEKVMKCIEFARFYNIRISSNILIIFLLRRSSDPGFVSYLQKIAEEDQTGTNRNIENLIKRHKNSEKVFSQKKKEERQT